MKASREMIDLAAPYIERAISAALQIVPEPIDTALLKKSQVEWVVNDIAELGVKIGEQFFWLYKGESLVYDDPVHDNTGKPMHWRPVFKREFGECCHPINYDDPRLIGTVSLEDSDEWKALPKPPTPTKEEQ